MATSGTVGATKFDVRRVIDSACRRAGFLPQKIGSEGLDIARGLLYTTFTEWVAAGFPLWTRGFTLQGLVLGSPEVVAPDGVVEVLHAYWRILQPWRGTCTANGVANDTLFSGQPEDDTAILGPNPSVTVDFTSPTELDTIGVLTGGVSTYTAALQVYTSDDDVTYTLYQTLPSATYAPGQWVYFDLDPVVVASQFVKLVNPQSGTWTVSAFNFGLANGQDIELGVLNIDDYYNLPDKQMLSERPNSLYVARQVSTQVMKIWPVPNEGAFYNGTVSVLTRRYIQDPGALTNTLEVPKYWLEATIWRLAQKLYYELPAVLAANGEGQMQTYLATQERMARKADIESNATKAEAIAWAEERTRGPIRLTPSIAPYSA